MRFFGNQFEIGIGAIWCYPRIQEGIVSPILVIEEELIAGVKIFQSQIFLYLKIFDGNGNLLLQVQENELVYSTQTWDVKFEGKRLTIHQAAQKILLSILFEPPNKVVIDKGQILYRGTELSIQPTELKIKNGPTFSGRNESRNENCLLIAKKSSSLKHGGFGYFVGIK